VALYQAALVPDLPEPQPEEGMTTAEIQLFMQGWPG